jgi:RHS repeat-associated protein
VDPNHAYAQVIEEAEQQGSGTPTLKALYAVGDDRIRRYTPAVAGSGGGPSIPAGLRYYHADGLGSTRLLTDDTAAVTDQLTYEAFGEVDAAASVQTSDNAFLYTGEQFDPNSGFYYLRARYMNPANGRFTQQDGFGGFGEDPQSLHKYTYASNDPAAMVDPSGHFSLGETQAASGIRNTLANMQSEAGMVAIDVMMNRGKFDPVRYLATATIIFAAAKYLPGWLKRAKACSSNSFDGRTLVSTRRGLVPISEIGAGEVVWGWDEANDQEGWYAVTATIHGRRDYEMIELMFSSGEKIEATVNHPFYIEKADNVRAKKTNAENSDEYESDHWVRADLIVVGERVRLKGGEFTKLVGVRKYSKVTHVYNLSVNEARTFFVGRSGVQTHNACSYFSMTRGSVMSFRTATAKAEKEMEMATDLAYHTDYRIFLPEEPVGHNLPKNVDAIIETTQKGLELKRINSASRSAVKTAIEEGIKRGADPAAKVLYIDGMAAGLDYKIFKRGIDDRKLRSPDPFHKLEEIYVRYGDGTFGHYMVGEL